MKAICAVVLMLAVNVYAFAGSDDKFLKKYAMMKIYESCFGDEVIRQIRREMKQACAKCAGAGDMPMPPPANPMGAEQRPMGEEENFRPHRQENIPQVPLAPHQAPQLPQGIDAEKLHQAIFAFRPNAAPQAAYRPFTPASPPSFYGPFGAAPQFTPMGASMYYPGFQQLPFSPYAFPIPAGGQSYFGSRMSRDMDIRSQIEAITSRMSGKARNVTCILQELGYLDENFEPNFARINERINNLPIAEELRKDMLDGVSFCQQFSQCVPDMKKEKSPLSRDFVRPMFFFKCYKHKKLEACIMKDMREKFSGVGEEDFETDLDLRRTGRSRQIGEDKEVEDLSNIVYEFLYAGDGGVDLDAML
ncbi:unnamed protein product [Acanthoscelides obtectus]|nr:unnamed protein product [Acanthoscelides obtectus]CAK1630419.1 hypothetical protein AOBTE_LOCUS6316 [Acanthoscelides obtectus]